MHGATANHAAQPWSSARKCGEISDSCADVASIHACIVKESREKE